MANELALPDWAKKGAVPQAFAALNPQDDSLSEGIGQSYPVIGYKGKIWSFRFRGERKTFIRPDDGTPAGYLDVIILGQAKTKSKSFYKAFDPNQSEGDRPICSSIDGITPDPDVTMKQSDACALCPRNMWKTQPNGKKGRECTDYKRLAVLVLPTQTSLINNGEPVLEPAFLRVPPASLNSLAIMGDTMSAQGYHYSSYITRITFDPNEAHPKMVFRPLQGLTEQEAPTILQLREDMQVDRIINGGFSEGQRMQPQLAAPGATQTGLIPPPSTVATSAAPSPGGSSTALASVQPVTPATPPPAHATVPSGLVNTGLSGGPTSSGIAPPAPTQQASAPVQQTVGDTGAPEATDDDLDAKLAKLIGKK